MSHNNDYYNDSYPDIHTMRETINEYGYNCYESPISFVQSAYDMLMIIKDPETHPDDKGFLEKLLQGFIHADSERNEEVNTAKRNQGDSLEFENDAFRDFDIEIEDAIRRANERGDSDQ